MPRRPRVFVEGGIYHIYNRLARGAELFSEPEEAVEFLEIIRIKVPGTVVVTVVIKGAIYGGCYGGY